MIYAVFYLCSAGLSSILDLSDVSTESQRSLFTADEWDSLNKYFYYKFPFPITELPQYLADAITVISNVRIYFWLYRVYVRARVFIKRHLVVYACVWYWHLIIPNRFAKNQLKKVSFIFTDYISLRRLIKTNGIYYRYWNIGNKKQAQSGKPNNKIGYDVYFLC